MKTPTSVHISSLERLYFDELVTDTEYQKIMSRIVAVNVEEKRKEKGGGNNG